ncbi:MULTISPECIES: hypothetical protein [unclassified Siphonobacter]|nr:MULTISPECIES: hypothetical protein [unclassified Siphonobacter]
MSWVEIERNQEYKIRANSFAKPMVRAIVEIVWQFSLVRIFCRKEQ